MAPLTEVGPLLAVTDAFARLFVDLDPLLKRGVVKLAPLPQQIVKCTALRLRRIEAVLVAANHWLPPLLGFYVLTNRLARDGTGGATVVGACPQRGQAASQIRELLTQNVARLTLNPMHDLMRSKRRWEGDEHVQVVRPDDQLQQFTTHARHYFANQSDQAVADRAGQDRTAIFRAPDEVVVDIVGRVLCLFSSHNLILA